MSIQDQHEVQAQGEAVTSIRNNKNISEVSLVQDSKITKERFSPLLRQCLAASGPLMCSIAAGMTVGYSAILLPELQKNTSRIKISLEEASWIASIAPLPMAVGCLIGGIIMQRYGRRMAHFILCFPFVIGWVVLSMSVNVGWILLGRFITGFCVGLVSPPAPVYIGEVTAPKYRGIFLACVTLGVSLGILIVHSLGMFFTWQITALICGTFPFMSYILLAFVPESPSWLLAKGRTVEAEEAFKWLRGHDEETHKEFESMLEKQQNNNNNSDNDVRGNWQKFKDTLTAQIFYKPLLILLIFFATMQFAGLNVIIFYSITILKQIIGGHINEYIATLIIDVVRLLASFIACIMLKKSGRRLLASISGTGTTICLLCLSLYLYVSKGSPELKSMSWIPLCCLAGYIAFVTVGMNPLPWCMVGELFPLQFRALGSAIVTFFNFFCVFMVIKTSPFLLKSYGGEGTFLLYGACTLLGTIYLVLFLPETRNRSLQEIENEFAGKNVSETNEKENKNSTV